MSKCEKVKLIDVCNRIFAGGDVPKGNYSLEKNEKFNVPIYTNGEKNLGLYGYTDTAKVFEPSVTISARGTIGFAAVRTVPFYPAIRLITLTPNERIDVRFLYYITQNYQFNKGGTSIPQLTVPMLKNYTFPLPDIEKQKRIVSVFDKLNFLIDLLNSEIKKLDELVKSRFVEMFGDPVSNTLEWHRQQIIELTTKIGSGATPKGGRDSYCSEGISLIRSMNVHNGFFEYKDLAHISDEQAAKLSNVIIQKNDVLLNITGASVARCCVVPDEILPARVNQHVCIIRCNDHVLPVFISKAFTSDSFQKYLLEIAGSGATREAITKQQIEQISMIVPPLLFQNQFAEFVAQVEKQKATVKKSLEKLETLKKSLMQEYFG